MNTILTVFKFCASELTCFGHLDQLVIAELIQVLFHLRDGLRDWAEGEVGVDGHRWQHLRLRLGYQHVVALTREEKQPCSHDKVYFKCVCFSPVLHRAEHFSVTRGRFFFTLTDTHLCLTNVSVEWLCQGYLDEVDVVLSAGQLGDLAVPPLQIGDLMGQTLHVALCVVERRSLVGGDELGHLLLHPLNGAHHVGKHLLAFLQRRVG